MTAQTESEVRRLEGIATDSWYARGVNTDSILYSAKVFRRFWKTPRCLELGPAEGVMTAVLSREFAEVTAVDGSAKFCRELAARHPRVTVIRCLIEDFSTDEPFDTVLLGRVLEHVGDPRQVLRLAKEWLKPDGVICAAVPNARSLHRQAAVLMGLLASEYELNEADRHHGHRRVYNPESLRADFTNSGLRVSVLGGYWLKPVSNAQIESDWTREMLTAFMALGERYPDIAGEIYAIATR